MGLFGKKKAKETVQDPVCGMTFSPAEAGATIGHGDHAHYFCSVSCQEKFMAEPARYH